MKLLHINHDKTRLLIFFLGFYTDENCFLEFDNQTSDILFVYDYSNTDFSELSYFDFTPYVEINLIAYSYGVFAANIAHSYLPFEINKSTAISGTIYPIDENYGIKPKVYDLMLGAFSEDVINNFKSKMELNSNGLIKEAKRSLENLYMELKNIKNYVLENEIKKTFDFDTVILTKKDRIIPYSAQNEYWINFPFFEFKNFDEILEL